MMLRKPEHLNDSYTLHGPERLFITGPLDQAYTAQAIDDAIHYLAGTNGTWWPTLDGSLFFLGGKVPNPNRQSVKRLKNEDSQRLRQDFSRYQEVMFVNEKNKVDSETAFKIGRAIGSAAVDVVYYFGKSSSLGGLEEVADSGELTVIQDPASVFYWQDDQKNTLRATSADIIDLEHAKRSVS